MLGSMCPLEKGGSFLQSWSWSSTACNQITVSIAVMDSGNQFPHQTLVKDKNMFAVSGFIIWYLEALAYLPQNLTSCSNNCCFQSIKLLREAIPKDMRWLYHLFKQLQQLLGVKLLSCARKKGAMERFNRMPEFILQILIAVVGTDWQWYPLLAASDILSVKQFCPV